MSFLKHVRQRAVKGLFDGLNRADEIGGELRDFITERVIVDERYVALRKRIAALRGGSYTSRAEQDAHDAAEQAAAAAAAPPPAASVKPKEKALGDPELPAQIYGKESCPWSGRAIRLLEDMKVDYDFIDLDEVDDPALANELIAATKQNTVPYVYVRGEFVGGFNALSELQRAGQLEYLLKTPQERETANPALKKITITPRPNSDEVAPGEI